MSPDLRDTSFIEKRSPNLAVQFRDRVAASPDAEAFRVPAEDGQPWVSSTWKQAGDRVEKLAAGLLSLGIESEQRVGIAAGTRLEWIEADLAVLCAGASTTTVYPSTMAADVAYILADSGSRIVFAENDEQVQKLRDHQADLPDLFKIVVFDPSTSSGQEGDEGLIISLDDLVALGEKHLADHPDAVDRAVAGIVPDQLATLIYTSGTTGKPKGVRLTHASWTYEGAVVQSQKILDENDLQFLWLPMAHSFGKVLLSAQLACGFATAIDGRVDRIIDNVGIVRPTFMGAAPRIFEKAYARIITMQESEGGAKARIFNAAFAVGKKRDALVFAGKPVPLTLKLQHAVFDRLVFSKIRDRFGGRIRFFLSGSAALNREIAEWFHAAGLLILEGYGLTETTAGAFVNSPDDYKIGTVGPAFPGSQVKLGEGDEIMIKGPNIMAGYHNLPEETAKTLTDDGWLHTGDKGSIDADGFLTITGRIKELFKTSGGKYVAPPAIEAKMKALCPYVSQFMVFGNERNYCIALVTLDPDAMAGWAKENGKAGASYSDVVGSAEAQTMVADYVTQLNAQLNRWETVKKFEILDHDLTIESGELTPSLKVKRNVVEVNNKELIDALYA
ncbi:MAG: putative acyl-CoA ligase/synthetase [Marmoricola sp.]|nr:putative acyl-CoA ligase/synthetase [Marmoricola sp.]